MVPIDITYRKPLAVNLYSMEKIEMKVALIAVILNFLIIDLDFLPKVSLLVMMALAMGLDFLTGVLKAFALRQKFTSKRLRQTIIKFIQYGGAILIGLMISYIAADLEKEKPEWKYAQKTMSWFNNGLLVLIIIIELRSITENLYEMNTSNIFARKVLNPMIKIFTVKINNNPVATYATEETESDTDIKIEEKVIAHKDIIP